MKPRILGLFAASALLGAALATTSVAQDRQRGFEGPRGFDEPRGEARGAAGQIRRGMRGMRGGPRGGAVAQPQRFIERHDTDADGQVSESEFLDSRLQHIDTLFERRDADGNGLISADEQAAPRGLRNRPARAGRGAGARPGRPELDREAIIACVRETIADYEPRFDEVEPGAVFDNVDTDGDGTLSLQEVSSGIAAQARELFARIDGNGDGYLDEDEVAAHVEAQLNVRRVARACVDAQRGG